MISLIGATLMFVLFACVARLANLRMPMDGWGAIKICVLVVALISLAMYQGTTIKGEIMGCNYPAIPQTDEEVLNQLDAQYGGKAIVTAAKGLYNVRRKKGDSVAVAYEKVLLAIVGESIYDKTE